MIQATKQVVRTWGTSLLEASKALFDAFNSFKFGEVSLNPPSIAAGTAAAVSVALPAGTAQAGDLVIMQPPYSLEAGLLYVGATITATDTLSVKLYNSTAAAIDGAGLTWTYLTVAVPRRTVLSDGGPASVPGIAQLILAQTPARPTPGQAVTYSATYAGTDVTAVTLFSTSDPAIVTVDPPTVTAISPAAIKQGESKVFTLTGTNFRSGQTIGGLPAGVTASALGGTETSLTVTLAATASATLGAAAIFVADPTHGDSGTVPLDVTSTVGNLPVTSGLVLRLHANAGVAVSGSAVTSWTDQSTIGSVFSQATGTAQPTLVANAYNNTKPTLRFAGAQSLVAPAAIPAFNTVDFTLFVVMKTTSATATQRAWSNVDTAAFTGDSFGVTLTDGTVVIYQARVGSGTAFGSIQSPNQPVPPVFSAFAIRSTTGIPETLQMFINGTKVSGASLNRVANTTAAPTVGMVAGGTDPFSGDVCEIIRFNRSLTDAELASMATYFQTEWGTL